jgi:hypothetical protein
MPYLKLIFPPTTVDFSDVNYSSGGTPLWLDDSPVDGEGKLPGSKNPLAPSTQEMVLAPGSAVTRTGGTLSCSKG